MLKLVVPISPEGWDEVKEEFVEPKTQILELEHSLVSISKWESKWHRAFLSGKEKTFEETLDYIRCMTLTENIDPEVYSHLTQSNIQEVNSYIEAPMTATVFNKQKSGDGKSKDVPTSELIYYWMISQNIPFECQNWHLNRLLTLIRVCNIKNAPPGKKQNPRELARNYAEMNKANRAKYHSKG